MLSDILLLKSRPAAIGEIRVWGGHKYRKEPTGWVLVPSESREYKADDVIDALGKENAVLAEKISSLTDPSKKGVSGLSGYEDALLTTYTSSEYRTINNSLRTENPTNFAIVYNNQLNDTLDKLPPYKGVVYRVVGVEDVDKFVEQLVGQSTTEGYIQFATPVSTSKNKQVVHDFGGNVVFEIESKSGRDISHFSEFPEEEEVLFKNISKFKLKGKVKIKEFKTPYGVEKYATIKLTEI